MKLRIMNETGHTELELGVEEMIEQINDHPTHGVFIDDEAVSRDTVNEINWETVDTVTLSPAIVGGN